MLAGVCFETVLLKE